MENTLRCRGLFAEIVRATKYGVTERAERTSGVALAGSRLSTWKNGMEENAAISFANQDVGRNWAERLAKSRSGDLDRISAAVTEAAVKNAKAIRDAGTLILQEGPSRFVN